MGVVDWRVSCCSMGDIQQSLKGTGTVGYQLEIYAAEPKMVLTKGRQVLSITNQDCFEADRWNVEIECAKCIFGSWHEHHCGEPYKLGSSVLKTQLDEEFISAEYIAGLTLLM